MTTPETKWTPSALASAQRNPDALAVRSASLRNLAVNMMADPYVLHDAADMLYGASQELEALRKEIAALRAALRECADAIGPAGHPAAVNSTLWAKARKALSAEFAAERAHTAHNMIADVTPIVFKLEQDRAELIEALRVLAEVFQSFCNDVGNHHESYQREHIAAAKAIVAKHPKE